MIVLVMNKKLVMFFMSAGMLLGAYIPVLLGWDPMGLNGLSILGGLVGGAAGIWLGILVSRYV
jgi:hypothetical protein